jgi:hypothetical protein
MRLIPVFAVLIAAVMAVPAPGPAPVPVPEAIPDATTMDDILEPAECCLYEVSWKL